jgi:signal transduction histidine kinase
MGSDFGLARADLVGLEACGERGQCQLSVARFTTADGLRSRETSVNSHPTALRTRAGELWFATPRGVVIADPRHFRALPSPPVAIERFAVDDQDEDWGGGQQLRIAAGHLRFQFDYAGLSFAAGQKLRYEYTLEGFDKGWTEAGARRTAYYTNIPPGRYRFRVRAMLADEGAGSGGMQEAALSFQLLPHFYQTVWFGVLLVLAGAGLVVLVFRRRVLGVEREFRAVMGERSRLAREIHDTLAQGYVGVSMQLEVLGELLRHNRAEAAQKHLKLTQDQVREGLEDARQSIWALRSQDAGEQTLPVRLRRLVEKAAGRSLTTGLEVHGAYRALSPGTEKEILRIAQEAIHNVEKHAGASSLGVRLEYDQRVLAVTVTDNGKGFAMGAGHDAGEGHYGLTGMRERAALIHARIEITSRPGEGTTVRMEVAAPQARKPEDAAKE